MIQTKDEQAKRPERTFIMYPNNIYIKNYNEVKQTGVLMSADERDLLGI